MDKGAGKARLGLVARAMTFPRPAIEGRNMKKPYALHDGGFNVTDCHGLSQTVQIQLPSREEV